MSNLDTLFTEANKRGILEILDHRNYTENNTDEIDYAIKIVNSTNEVKYCRLTIAVKEGKLNDTNIEENILEKELEKAINYNNELISSRLKIYNEQFAKYLDLCLKNPKLTIEEKNLKEDGFFYIPKEDNSGFELIEKKKYFFIGPNFIDNLERFSEITLNELDINIENLKICNAALEKFTSSKDPKGSRSSSPSKYFEASFSALKRRESENESIIINPQYKDNLVTDNELITAIKKEKELLDQYNELIKKNTKPDDTNQEIKNICFGNTLVNVKIKELPEYFTLQDLRNRNLQIELAIHNTNYHLNEQEENMTKELNTTSTTAEEAQDLEAQAAQKAQTNTDTTLKTIETTAENDQDLELHYYNSQRFLFEFEYDIHVRVRKKLDSVIEQVNKLGLDKLGLNKCKRSDSDPSEIIFSYDIVDSNTQMQENRIHFHKFKFEDKSIRSLVKNFRLESYKDDIMQMNNAIELLSQKIDIHNKTNSDTTNTLVTKGNATTSAEVQATEEAEQKAQTNTDTTLKTIETTTENDQDLELQSKQIVSKSMEQDAEIFNTEALAASVTTKNTNDISIADSNSLLKHIHNNSEVQATKEAEQKAAKALAAQKVNETKEREKTTNTATASTTAEAPVTINTATASTTAEAQVADAKLLQSEPLELKFFNYFKKRVEIIDAEVQAAQQAQTTDAQLLQSKLLESDYDNYVEVREKLDSVIEQADKLGLDKLGLNKCKRSDNHYEISYEISYEIFDSNAQIQENRMYFNIFKFEDKNIRSLVENFTVKSYKDDIMKMNNAIELLSQKINIHNQTNSVTTDTPVITRNATTEGEEETTDPIPKKQSSNSKLSKTHRNILIAGLTLLAATIATSLCAGFLAIPALFPLAALFAGIAGSLLALTLGLRSHEPIGLVSHSIMNTNQFAPTDKNNILTNKLQKLEHSLIIKKVVFIAATISALGLTTVIFDATVLPMFNAGLPVIQVMQNALTTISEFCGPNLLPQVSNLQLILCAAALIAGILTVVAGTCLVFHNNKKDFIDCIKEANELSKKGKSSLDAISDQITFPKSYFVFGKLSEEIEKEGSPSPAYVCTSSSRAIS